MQMRMEGAALPQLPPASAKTNPGTRSCAGKVPSRSTARFTVHLHLGPILVQALEPLLLAAPRLQAREGRGGARVKRAAVVPGHHKHLAAKHQHVGGTACLLPPPLHPQLNLHPQTQRCSTPSAQRPAASPPCTCGTRRSQHPRWSP